MSRLRFASTAAAVLLAGLVLAGCSQQAATQTPPHKAADANESTMTVSAAKALLAEQRPSLDPRRQQPAHYVFSTVGPDGAPMKVSPPAAAAAAAIQSQVVKFGRGVWLPNRDVLGPPISVRYSAAHAATTKLPPALRDLPAELQLNWWGPMGPNGASGVVLGLTATPTTRTIDYARPGLTPDQSLWAEPWAWGARETSVAGLYAPRKEETAWARVAVRGNPGYVYVLGGNGKGAPFGGTDLIWVEDGVLYVLRSQVLYADQLLAIADTMVPVKP